MISKTYYRYIWLLNVLLPGEPLTYEEIVELWKKDPNNGGVGLPLRTFHEHRKGVKEMFGVDILCDKYIGYTYYVKNAGVLDDNKPAKWLLQHSSIPKDFFVYYKMRDRVLLEEITSGTEWVKPIIQAMQKNVELEVDYQKHEGHRETFHVHPYALKVYNRHWYLLGYIKEKESVRTLGLDRMLDVQSTRVHFNLPDGFDAQKYYANTVGVYVNEENPVTEVRIRAYDTQVEYIRSSPLHKSQKEVKSKKEGDEYYSEFTYKVSITPELISQLLAMRDRVEVLEPVELKEEMKERINSMLNLYK